MAVSLYDHQLKAVKKLKNGSILVGGVGSGKSRTAIGWFFKQNHGEFEPNYRDMKGSGADFKKIPDLYIITTARKRDTMEWEDELAVFKMSTNPEINHYSNQIVVDSWNNIKKYEKIEGACFIFDEQRVVGSGQWAKSFIKLAKKNQWILLSATPGDTWMDYAAVFIANGFYKNFSEFRKRHVVYSRYTSFPKVDHYVECGTLERHRNDILVYMAFRKVAKPHDLIVKCDYDREMYTKIKKKRWNPYKDEPCMNAGELCQVLRRLVNSDKSRCAGVLDVFKRHSKVIIFYNYNYELEILRETLEKGGILSREWNGHKHEALPEGEKWAYLVQYTAGAEGWNCIETNCILFYSDTYSFKQSIQAKGRIDRLTTPYPDLYYYHLRSSSSIDVAIFKCLEMKRDFNEKKFVGEEGV